jgi:hypothetical protein
MTAKIQTESDNEPHYQAEKNEKCTKHVDEHDTSLSTY